MLSKDFREFIELLNKNEVDYLIVGGYAVGFHGYPRYTKDIDIWIESSAENASKLLTALEVFGFGSLDLNIDDFTTPDRIVQSGYPPNLIDLTSDFGEGRAFRRLPQNRRNNRIRQYENPLHRPRKPEGERMYAAK